jgi:hypothetical protein
MVPVMEMREVAVAERLAQARQAPMTSRAEVSSATASTGLHERTAASPAMAALPTPGMKRAAVERPEPLGSLAGLAWGSLALARPRGRRRAAGAGPAIDRDRHQIYGRISRKSRHRRLARRGQPESSPEIVGRQLLDFDELAGGHGGRRGEQGSCQAGPRVPARILLHGSTVYLMQSKGPGLKIA